MNNEKNSELFDKALLTSEKAQSIMVDNMIANSKKALWSMVKYKELQMTYVCAMKEIKTKFDVLNTEFNVKNKRNPISSVSSRLKSTESIARKMIRKGFPLSIDGIEDNLNDVAGVRVICSYIDDIYQIADALLKQNDITLVERKDYIKNPKPNGYRSLHLIVKVPVFFAEKSKEVKVEVQIRTIAMDFWASLEHQMKYKQEIPNASAVIAKLKDCAEIITRTDEEMLGLRKHIESAADAPSEEDEMWARLSKMDAQIG